MKRILFVLAASSLPLLAEVPQAAAQETYSFPATANQQVRVERRRVQANRTTCLRLNAVGGATCTQAQACTAAGAAGGAGCNVTQARAANAEIFAATLAGRTAMIEQRILIPFFTDAQNQSVAEDKDAQCIWWRNPATTRAAKDIACNAVSPPLGNNCELCQ
jgi:hypothetical protein